MDIRISGTSEEPIYQQIYDQLSREILCGTLPGGSCLPPIRTMALNLRISVITVKRAYEELERSGFIYTMAGKGCFVQEFTHADRENRRDDLLLSRIRKDVAYYRSMGLGREEIVARINACL